jgi:hypothetical protein
LPSFDTFAWHILRVSPNKYKYKSQYLTPCCGLEVQNPTQALKSFKDPVNTFDLNSKWERTLPSFSNCSWNIYRVPPYKNLTIKVDI